MSYDEVAALIGPRRLSSDPGARNCLDMRASITRLIESADEELIIVAFRLDADDILDRIIARSDDGVEVTIHLDHGQIETEGAPRGAYDRLNQHGIVVERWEQDRYHSLHAKVLIADGQRAIIGSANLTDRGLDRNVELGIWLEGPTVGHLRSALMAALSF